MLRFRPPISEILKLTCLNNPLICFILFFALRIFLFRSFNALTQTRSKTFRKLRPRSAIDKTKTNVQGKSAPNPCVYRDKIQFFPKLTIIMPKEVHYGTNLQLLLSVGVKRSMIEELVLISSEKKIGCGWNFFFKFKQLLVAKSEITHQHKEEHCYNGGEKISKIAVPQTLGPPMEAGLLYSAFTYLMWMQNTHLFSHQ